MANSKEQDIGKQLSNDPGNTQVKIHVSSSRDFFSNKVVLVGLIVIPILMTIMILGRHRDSEGPCICLHKDCIEYSVFLARSIRSKLDPCDDFYEYACGNYHAQDNEAGMELMLEQLHMKAIQRRMSMPIAKLDYT